MQRVFLLIFLAAVSSVAASHLQLCAFCAADAGTEYVLLQFLFHAAGRLHLPDLTSSVAAQRFIALVLQSRLPVVS